MIHGVYELTPFVAKGINGFSQEDNHVKRHEGDRNGLYFFIIAIGSMFTIGIQNYYFAAAAANLTRSLRSLSFKAVLRQDIEYFDQEEHSTGGIVSSLSDDPQKVNGLAGVTLGAIVQAISTLVVGVVLGLIFAWRVGLVGLACAPLLVTTGYIRLQVVVLKDQKNKKEHEASAQIACEAAGAIRTVASLTREDDCARIYSQALEAPLKNSNRTALWSNILYAMSQALSFFVIALVFWYGSRQVADGQLTVFHFFIGLMVRILSLLEHLGLY
jgi:ATP-binding cassette subfamily B (MDR/TAP) protein 1